MRFYFNEASSTDQTTTKELHGYVEHSLLQWASLSRKKFSDSCMPILYCLSLTPIPILWGKKSNLGMGKEVWNFSFLSLKFPMLLDSIVCHQTSWHQAAAFCV